MSAIAGNNNAFADECKAFSIELKAILSLYLSMLEIHELQQSYQIKCYLCNASKQLNLKCVSIYEFYAVFIVCHIKLSHMLTKHKTIDVQTIRFSINLKLLSIMTMKHEMCISNLCDIKVSKIHSRLTILRN